MNYRIMNSVKLPGKRAKLEDLSNFSPWPVRLLGIEKFNLKKKNKYEINREYELEKWQPILEKVKQTSVNITVEEVDRWMFGKSQEVFCCVNKQFRVMSASDCHKLNLELIEETLKDLLPFSNLVEIGAGYGSIILNLAKKNLANDLSIIATEWTPSGRSIITELARNEKIEVEVGYCDLSAEKVIDLHVPKDSVIFTTGVFPCIKKLRKESFIHLAKFKPKAVVHFEPFFEEYTTSNLWDLLVQSYILKNDYNRNGLSVLEELEKDGTIKILKRRKAYWGINAIFPYSILIWKPNIE